MLCQGGCSDSDELDAHPPVYEEVKEILTSQDEEAQETQQAKDKHYSLAPTLSGVRSITHQDGNWRVDVRCGHRADENGEWQCPGPSSLTPH